ncbi:MAG: helix-turn-helix domain-containing protein [Gammaproteobacteria bacterium]|nr:helix-turn-helix domain-containing protein [Gammaproteobacteria bacterium]
MAKIRKRDTQEQFRTRLREVIERSGLSKTAFADSIGADRSTLSQLLSRGATRLPRAETIAAIARSTQTSADWLLGLTQEGQLGADVVEEAVAIEYGAGSPSDARLQRWHAEAAGYKIRYVPSTIPDLLKTEEVIRYEFSVRDPTPPEARIEQAEARLAYSRRPETDMEVCSSVQSVESFARGEGIWRKLSIGARRSQLDMMAEILDELYPKLRWFLYDGLERFSAPMTIFGPLRAAVYLGNMYLVFTSTEHIRAMTDHFDSLIRIASVQPHETKDVVLKFRKLIT